ncbi:MAG: hypothetical protein Q9M94_02985 [Candidatus Gracilibacteria bacterium]|nr:hypothetical protein [Candidatus Gracilibacteria bacterium]MDQ7022698.1 hypothetical protein [Candidatus Gracilibacteria bacterium]
MTKEDKKIKKYKDFRDKMYNERTPEMQKKLLDAFNEIGEIG